MMQLDENSVKQKSANLVGFSDESKSTMGKVDLQIFIEGVNLTTTFLLVNSDSAYNAILERPRIHDMKAIHSTYHQKVKFSMP